MIKGNNYDIKTGFSMHLLWLSCDCIYYTILKIEISLPANKSWHVYMYLYDLSKFYDAALDFQFEMFLQFYICNIMTIKAFLCQNGLLENRWLLCMQVKNIYFCILLCIREIKNKTKENILPVVELSSKFH